MKKLLYFLIVLTSNLAFAQVGIGTTMPDDSSLLDVTSTDSGILVPRLTDAQRDAIATPASSLLIFNVDIKAFQYNRGTSAAPNWTTLVDSQAIPTTMHGYIDGSTGSLNAGNAGFTTSRLGAGQYRITFDIALSNDNYTVIVTPDRVSGSDDTFVGVTNRTNSTFDIYISDEDDGSITNNYVDQNFSMVVYVN